MRFGDALLDTINTISGVSLLYSLRVAPLQPYFQPTWASPFMHFCKCGCLAFDSL